MDSSKKRVLLTGATGFIGKALLAYLLDNGFQVRALTRSLKLMPAKTGLEWVQGDLTCPETLQSICDGVEYVFHLAGFAHAWEENCTGFDQIHHEVNFLGTLNLAKQAKQAHVKRFIFFSTVKACAEQNKCIDESDSTWPDTVYGIKKREAEEILLALCSEGPMLAVVLRPALVYGPGWKGNLASMLKAIDRGYFPSPPPCANKKSMISVDDLCRAVQLSIEIPLSNSTIFILTDGVEYSTRQIYEWMREALLKKKRRFYWPLFLWRLLARLGDGGQKILKKRLPLSSQAMNKLFGNAWYCSIYTEKILQFQPQYTLRDILPKIIACYKEESQ